MRAKWYGRPQALRAAATASRFAASRLKNQTPGSRPSRCTYVRTFVSWKASGNGSQTGCTRVIVNGTTPTNACPSNVSSASPGGSSGSSTCGATGQCRNVSSDQLW